VTGIVDFRTELLDENGDPISASNPLPVTGGGGGGGTLSDTVFIDSTNQLFVYRDTGSGVPLAYEIPSWALYSPVGAVSVAAGSNAAASATGAAVPGSAGYTGFNSGGNLVGVSSANPLPVSVDNFPATQDVSGTVSVDNFPATQDVSGTVSVDNFPATQDVNIVGGSSGNAAAGTTGAAVPSSADYVGYNVGGNLTGVSETTPLPVAEVNQEHILLMLTRMLSVLAKPANYDASLNRQRITAILESGTVTTVSTVTGVTTVTTVATVTNLTNFGTGRAATELQDNNNRTAWALTNRARIT